MEFKKYQPKYHDELRQCLEKSFAMKISPEAFKWKYFSRIGDKEEIIYTALDNEKIASCYFNISFPVIKKQQLFNARICAAIATLPEYRRQGLISKLAKQVYKEVENNNYEFTVGFSNQSGIKVDQNSRNYGYSIVGQFKQYQIPAKPRISKNNLTCRIWQVDDKLDFTKFKRDEFNLSSLEAYFKWRYLDNPKQNFRIYVIEYHKKIIGYFVLHLSKTVASLYDLAYSKASFTDIIELIRELVLTKSRLVLGLNVLDNSFWQKQMGEYNIVKTKSIEYYLTVKRHSYQQDDVLDKDNWFLLSGSIL